MDKREAELPNIGLVRIKDAETGALSWIDTSNTKVREQYAKSFLLREVRLNEIFNRSGIDSATIDTSVSYINTLMNLFKRREKRR
jgi:hypothetical protein